MVKKSILGIIGFSFFTFVSLGSCQEKPLEYSISSSTNGVVLKGPSKAKFGEKITLNIDTGTAALREVKANGILLNENKDDTYSFIMPRANVDITCKLDPKGYLVHFYNYDNSLLDTTYVGRGETAKYKKLEPTQSGTNSANYIFKGWDKSLDNIQEDTNFYAQYIKEDLSNMVFELNEDGASYNLNYCDSTLENLVVPSTYLDLPVVAIGDGAFKKAKSKVITIPESILSIGKEAFQGNTFVEEIKGMENVTTIGDSAFSKTTNLKKIALNTALTSLGDYAFEYSGLIDVALPDTITTSPKGLFRNSPNLTSVHIPQNWVSIPDYFFEECPNLKEFNWPTYVSEIGGNVFQGNKVITEFALPKTITKVSWYVFADMDKLKSVDLSNCIDLKEIKQWMFKNDSSLTSVKLPPKLENAAWNMFENCTALATVVLPNTLTKIDTMFKGCSNLKTLVVPDSVTSITSGSFAGCTSLEEITIPVSVTSISGIFEKDTKVTIHYKGSESEWEKVEGNDAYSNAKVTFDKKNEGEKI